MASSFWTPRGLYLFVDTDGPQKRVRNSLNSINTVKDYKRNELNYLRADNSRHIADTWTLREYHTNDEWDVDAILTLEGQEGIDSIFI